MPQTQELRKGTSRRFQLYCRRSLQRKCLNEEAWSVDVHTVGLYIGQTPRKGYMRSHFVQITWEAVRTR